MGVIVLVFFLKHLENGLIDLKCKKMPNLALKTHTLHHIESLLCLKYHSEPNI